MSKRWTSSSLLASASKCTWPLAYNSNTFTEGALERGRPPWQDGICPRLNSFGSPWTGRGLDAARHETHTLRDLALVAAHVGCGRRGPRASACKGALPLLYEKGCVMKIIKAKDYEDMSRKAANIISAQVILKPDCVLGLATGSTPIVPTSSSLLGTRRATSTLPRLAPTTWTSIAAFRTTIPRAITTSCVRTSSITSTST